MRLLVKESVAWAYKWQMMLDEGKVGWTGELAARHGIDGSYVGRVLKLTGPPTDITKAALRGYEQEVNRVMKLHKNLSVQWDEQRQGWLYQ